MAVKTGSIREFSEFASSKPTIDKPLTIYRGDNPDDDDCAVVFDKEPDITKIVFSGTRFRYEDGEKFRFIENDRQVDEGLAVLEILCGATPKTTLDRPEFVDIDKLSEFTDKTSCSPQDVLELSDDDDVVFVTEYKDREGEDGRAEGEGRVESVVIVDSDDSKGSDSRIRRNPVRTARNRAKGNGDKDVLFEEDFAFLDSSEDEADKKENKPPEKRTASTVLPKEWPVNVHERPEYNPLTKKVESFDYTIRDIKKRGAIKKTKFDAASSRRKPTKTAVKRKRKSVPEDRVPIEELKSLVNSTTDMLKDYFVNSKKHKDITNCQSEICTFENKLEILKNQALLFSIVNNLDENEVMEKFKLLNVENDAKDST